MGNPKGTKGKDGQEKPDDVVETRPDGTKVLRDGSLIMPNGVKVAKSVAGGQLPKGKLSAILGAVKSRVAGQMADEAAKAAEAYRKEVEDYVGDATPLLEDMVEVVLQSVGTPLGAEADQNIKTVLEAGGDVGTAARVRWVFGRIYVQKAIGAKQSLRDIVSQLTARGVIATPAEGKRAGVIRLTLGDDVYIPNGEYPEEARADVKGVFEALMRLAGTTRDAASIRNDERRTEFESDLSKDAEGKALGPDKFWSGVEGIYALYVSESSYDRKVRDAKGNDTDQSETIRLPGGRLKVVLDSDGKVEAIEGRGPFGRYVGGIAAVPGVYVTLGAAKDPSWRIPGQVFKKMSDDARRATGALHRLLHRAYKANVEWEKGAKAIEAFKARGPLPAAEFFTGKFGVAYIYHKSFGSGGKEYEFAGVLVERGEAGIRLVDSINCEGLMPEQAKEFAQEGEAFAGLVFPLNTFLKAAFGRVMEFDESSQTYKPRPKRDQANGSDIASQPKVDLPPAPVEEAETTEPQADSAQG